jgi:predicted aspartyl protease
MVRRAPMMSRPLHPLTWAGGLAAALLGAAGPASAACTLDTVLMPVTMVDGLPVVPGRLDGEPARFLLASGSSNNAVSAAYARERRMPPAQSPSSNTRLPADAQVTVRVIGGEVSAPVVLARSFEIADVTFRDIPFMALDSVGGADGLIGQVLLRQLDDDYALADGVMQLVRPHDCGQAMMAFWVRGEPYSVLPLETTARNSPHDVVSVTVDGVKLRAMLDTGAPTSFLTVRAAARAGVRTGAAGVTPSQPMTGFGRFKVRTWKSRFAKVQIGVETSANAELAIADTELDDADMVLGADFFLAHHVYVANSQRKVWFSANAAAPHAPRTPAAAR